METTTTVTVGKKKVSQMSVRRLENRINQQNPDPIRRLANKESSSKGDVAKSKQPTLDEAYSIMDVIKPPFSFAVMVRMPDLDPYLSGALDAIATDVSACKMEIAYTGKGEPPEKPLEMLDTFFFKSNDPTDPASLQEKVRVCALDYLMCGSWNLEITQLGVVPVDLVHAPAEFIRVKSDLSGYRMIKYGKSVDFNLFGTEFESDVNQFMRGINKKPGHRVYGKPIQYCLVNTVLMNSLRDEKNLQFFDQGSLADLLVLIENAIDSTVRDGLIADYQNTGAGQQAMYLLDGVGKAHIEQIKRDLESSSLTELEQNNIQRVLTALRVPPSKVAIYKDANRANTITQDEVFQDEVIAPIQKSFKTKFDFLIQDIIKEPDFEFVFTPTALKDRKVEAEVDAIEQGTGVATLNDLLRKAGKETVEFGDKHLLFSKYAKGAIIDMETGKFLIQPDISEGPGAETELVKRLIRLRQIIQDKMEEEEDDLD